MIMEEFRDIRIVDIDEENTARRKHNSEYFNVVFKLSETPPNEWWDEFYRQANRDCQIWDSVNYSHGQPDLIISMPIGRLRNDVRIVKEIAQEANGRIREKLEREAAELTKIQQKILADRELVREQLAGLEFD